MLGFGCGSVLGRVGRGASLRAMSTAWEQGISLFDTAPSYGFGHAEAVLGEFLRGKRQQAIVATKFGIAPQKQGTLRRLALPVARAALKAPGVRNLLRRGSREAAYGHFTVGGLRLSLETSLRELQTDYVDLLYLHEATASVLHQHDLMAELDTLLQAGKVLRVGLYGDSAVIAEGMANGPATLSAMQFGANPFDPLVAGFPQRNQRKFLLIANHPFGGEQRIARTRAALMAISIDEAIPAELRDKLGSVDWQTLIEAIFGMILIGAGTDALVFSMMREQHIRANLRAVEKCRFSVAELALMREWFLRSPAVAPGT